MRIYLRRVSTAGEAFSGSARIPVPMLVPMIRAAAPATLPFFSANLLVFWLN